MSTIVSIVAIMYTALSYLLYKQKNPVRLWVPVAAMAVYSAININGWTSWPAVIATIALAVYWTRKSKGHIDSGYRIIADLTGGRFGVPRQFIIDDPSVIDVLKDDEPVANTGTAPGMDFSDYDMPSYCDEFDPGAHASNGNPPSAKKAQDIPREQRPESRGPVGGNTAPMQINQYPSMHFDFRP